MTSPYSGATPTGAPQGGQATAPPQDHGSTQGNYTVPPQGASAQGSTAHGGSDHPDVENTSVGTLISEVTQDLSTLMRQELELAKAELTTEAKKAGQGAGMFGAAGFAGYMVLLFLSVALYAGLANIMDAGLSALIVAILWAVIGGVAFVMGRKKFRAVNPKPERTVETLQKVPGAVKPH